MKLKISYTVEVIAMLLALIIVVSGRVDMPNKRPNDDEQSHLKEPSTSKPVDKVTEPEYNYSEPDDNYNHPYTTEEDVAIDTPIDDPWETTENPETEEIIFEARDEKVYVANTTSGLKLRTTPNADSDANVAAIVYPGTELRRTGINGVWSRVTYNYSEYYTSSYYLSTQSPVTTPPETTEKAPTVCVNHLFDTGAVTKEATCTKAGTKKYTCYVCGYTKNETYTVEHVLVVDKSKQATCGTAGEIRTYCENCNYEKIDKVAALKHDYKRNSTTDPYICKNCGDVITPYAKVTHIANVVDDGTIILDGKRDPGYNAGSTIISTGSVYAFEGYESQASKAQGEFIANVVADTHGLYIYVEIEDSTIMETYDFDPTDGDYVKLYFDWTPASMTHPDADTLLNRELAGNPWDYAGYKNTYGTLGKQYLGWIAGDYNNGIASGMGFVPYSNLGPDKDIPIRFMVQTENEGWSCEWFIPWATEEQQNMVKNKVKFSVGLGIVVGDDIIPDDGEDITVAERYSRPPEAGKLYSENYALLPDIIIGR